MKDYLVRFKKVECRTEMGVRVGGLPGDIPGVLGTSVVHYKLIRNRVCVCVWGCARDCVCLMAGKEHAGEHKSHHVLFHCVCSWILSVCVYECVEGGENALSASGAEGRISQDTIYGDHGMNISGLQMLAAQYRPLKWHPPEVSQGSLHHPGDLLC